MASIFSKNGILLGPIDYYCLICAEHFMNEDESLAHIIDAQHKENLNTCGYFEKYKEDFIRKTKGIYFCELCSLTFPTAAKVELHIHEPSHFNEKIKISRWLKRVNNDIIVFDQYIISDDAWNGCVEDTCVLCNTEFEDSSSHKDMRSHVLNLIKSKVFFEEGNEAVYRTIDAKSNQCLTCNVIFSSDTASHSRTVDHKDAYKLYDPSILKNEPKSPSLTPKNEETAKETKKVKDNNENGDLKNSTKDVNGNIDGGITKAAGKNADNDVKEDTTSKKANKTVKKEATESLEQEATKPLDKEEVKDKPKQSAKKESLADLDRLYCKNLGAKDYVIETGPYTFCVLCELLLEDESRESHIRNKHHQTLLELHQTRLAENTPSKDEEKIPHESVERYQKKNIKIDLINEAAFCKKCSKSIDFNTTAIEKHIEEHDKKTKKKILETLDSGIKSNGTEKTTLFTKPVLLNKDKRQKSVSVEDYAKQHGFSHNRADNSFYCRPCCRRLPTTLDDLQKHVASKIHAENTKESPKSDTDKAPVKEPVFACIKYFECLHLHSINEEIIIINNKYWINAFGFFLIAKMNTRIFCYGCHIDLTPDNVLDHILCNKNHRDIIEKCHLITSLPDEFIREIKLDVYHCGFCNHSEEDWDDMLDHIATSEHKREKSKAEERLNEHRPNPYNRTTMAEIDEFIRNFARHNRLFQHRF